MIVRRVVPIATSIRPVLRTLPTSENALVPLLFLQPMDRYHSAPLLMMMGILTNVSTLLSTVGLSCSPFTTERMYFARGSPTSPATDRISADDSPHTKAPAPRL